MMLTAGAELGPYEIVAPLGAGGMGEVYRARDTKLGRDVALKVLPEAFAADAERMARFRREAQVLAALNHPNIAAIYGFEDSGSVHALVMELVNGPTLADRIESGAIPIDEALPIAKQICEAMEYAHEHGIVHRDLKPANIKLASNDAVKILDFGLAKALTGDITSTDVSSSPTISRMATQAGIILGTAAYMSPEQAKGKSVDRRTDIWAFGGVLYEMLTGKMAFSGETATDTLAAVLRAEPDWSQLPAATPSLVRDLLARCLKKDSRQRLQSIGDARIVIGDVLSGVGQDPASFTEPRAPESPWWRVFPWALAAVCIMAAVVVGISYLRRAPELAPTIISEISPPANTNFSSIGPYADPAVLSPDGKRLAFVAVATDGKQHLWVRALDSPVAQPLAGTDGSRFPFWSPDSHDLGYFANGKLNRIDASGGPPLALCDGGPGWGGTWGPDGTILFVTSTHGPILRVPDSGGTAQPALKIDGPLSRKRQLWPRFLPDGKHFLFFAQSSVAGESGIYVASLGGGDPRLISRSDSNAVYAPPGYLLFTRDQALMAQRFDLRRLRLLGDAAPLAEHVVESSLGFAAFSVSDNGILAFQEGDTTGGNRLLWFDRNGKQFGETGTPDEYKGDVKLSPDGHKLAMSINIPDSRNRNIWVSDLVRGVRTRVTVSASVDAAPAWSPDGKFIAFGSHRSHQLRIYQKPSDGTGTATLLVADDATDHFPTWSSDGRYIIFSRLATTSGSHREIWALPLFGNHKPFPIVQSDFDLLWQALSPNGKWVAYASEESGRAEVYVVPFPPGTGKWLVSTGGGVFPRWRGDGRELFYLSADNNELMAAEISDQGTKLAIGKVGPLFNVNAYPFTWPYDVTNDGKKFVVASRGEQRSVKALTLITNWPALLKKQE